MATKVLMPQLGESVTEGTISKWLVNVGDTVKKYDSLAEVTTDKVNAEVPSTVSGRVTEIVVPEGETVAVGTLILYIEESGAEGGAAAPASTPETTAPQAPAPATEQPKAAAPAVSIQQAPVVDGPKQRYSPAVVMLSQQHGIDLSRVVGTGAGGRITRKDVQAIIDAGGQKPAETVKETVAQAPVAAVEQSTVVSTPAPAASVSAPAVSVDIPVASGDQVVPVTAIRRTIANRMVQSKHEAPHAWTMVEVDVTNLVNFRNQAKGEFAKKEGLNLTFLPFFIKAVVEALKEYPMINSTWAHDKIIVKKDINISIAVATEDALYVPVIKHADQKSILGIAKAVDDLAARTRAGKLTMDDMTGGTFTVNNTGSFGSVLSQPIINAPQAAILSVESIVKRPVVINDMIAVRSMVNLCMSLDHRVLDGLICGRFLQSVKQKLENVGPDTKLY
ncbi:dihydrolipoamide acetyltransferase family protein [Brevibacillus brevis]|uniref:dihydrolipoamide acetyltransferase family protein n=1 Tax=Brevibacillus brevis TaxID=1393 RepID=UPI000D0E74D5|nr:dihydrolipoamide acetyltransferase family protein [Brevibacillus brevis]PSJ70665.1 branched-chain alpha-keto acid dehydrogenase subunit E2 [Brevibacillus brevis]RED31005.1 2-oxoisovalerate dehydrogenase E2 component (dihydrolipoyl transacylase) [Brevibacillus brevis]GEC90913.1 lipoamide acyltransferase component of branched-chain alpha-keto acid dehydrogenase complex [Brevibacillus brevis]VEF89781.1 Dihydrolipoyllysine-residue acetyltransferase component of pyruvate dehydrogenase complex [Br